MRVWIVLPRRRPRPEGGGEMIQSSRLPQMKGFEQVVVSPEA